MWKPKNAELKPQKNKPGRMWL